MIIMTVRRAVSQRLGFSVILLSAWLGCLRGDVALPVLCMAPVRIRSAWLVESPGVVFLGCWVSGAAWAASEGVSWVW